jgi:UDP-N-acetylglucosamine:LPS N-acetylglucosamine transferase
MALVDKGAALLVKNDRVAAELMYTMLQLAGDLEKRAHLAKNIALLAKADADILIANTILNETP